MCHADMHAAVEADTFGLHLRDAPVDVMLFHLEVGNAVAQQAAGPGVLLVDLHVVADAGELLGAGEARGSRSHDGRPTCRFLRAGGSGLTHPSAKARSTIAHSIVLMVTGLSSMLSVQDASHGAGQTRPVNSGKLLVECRLRERLVPGAEIDEIVPVGDLVVDRAAGVTIRDAAIHAARGLAPRLSLRQRQHEFPPMTDAFLDRHVVAVVALELEKTGDLSHDAGAQPEATARSGSAAC